ncbi:heterokaryon incompatibility protein-domain-containing protein [Hypoxylon fuscum]|nr:heterokaryon incompatibility protein-domain-containing protein [Hypoxylon fuscum]
MYTSVSILIAKKAYNMTKPARHSQLIRHPQPTRRLRLTRLARRHRFYPKLKEGEFRLLSFNNYQGTSCQLKTYQIDQAPPYIALSYTWGRARHRRGRPADWRYCIRLNGRQFEVQENLYDALRHIACTARYYKSLFWVDAVCIDQTNLNERSSQVRRMKEIFEKASCIYAWLGLPGNHEETRLAIKLMGDFRKYMCDGTAEHHDILAVRAALRRNPVAWPVNSDNETRKGWDGIYDIFNVYEQPYWGRTWIYQEVTTPVDVWFWCGYHTFDISYVDAVIDFGLVFSNLPGFHIKLLNSVGTTSYVVSIISARRYRQSGIRRRLIDQLFGMSTTSCTEPRDKVYVPLGHATDVTTDEWSIDYKRSLASVYIDVVRFYVFNVENPTLNVLGHVYIPADDSAFESLKRKHDPPVPSWVPDWRQIFRLEPFSSRNRGAYTTDLGYDPCPGTAVEAHIIGEVLKIRGIVMVELNVTALTDIWEENSSNILAIPRRWHDLFVSNESVTLDEPIRRALIGNAGRPSQDLDSQNGYGPRDQIVDWKFIDTQEDQLDSSMSQRKIGVIDDVTFVCFGKRMAMLTNGSIAIVPAAAKMGDQIALFHGGRCLYLVRPVPEQKNTFTFIGECYVDGFMDGAAMELNAQKGRESTLVQLV